nr:immunoglobulin light chain junction region [Macaca mulatta]MOW65370.1 immunoglobulin light chain junction region [Macaca mulatta]
CQKYISSPLSF